MGSNGRAKVPVPDAMTNAQWARVFANQLAGVQATHASLRVLQIAEEHEDTDPIAGIGPKMKDGEPVLLNGKPVFTTYGERRAELDAAIARVWKDAEERGVQKLVVAVIEKQRAEDALEEAELTS